MPRHSKNNTASAVFTYAERERLSYGTQKQRLGRDSFRPFHACFLCLQSATEPLCCPEGHIACKECFYESILSQKKALERQVKEQSLARVEGEAQYSFQHLAPYAAHVADDRPQKLEQEKRQEQKAKDVQDFYESSNKIVSSQNTSNQADTSRSLPSFWIPSLTPSVEKDELPSEGTVTKKDVMCLSSAPHPVFLKKLFPVKFTKAKEAKSGDERTFACASCSKQLNNGLKMSVLKPCGHVFCGHCTKEFVKPGKRCIVCDAKCKDRDIVALCVEGTGFSASGQVEAKRFDIAFQG
ncbi:hypothetical protein RI367_000057 [Sorochytrium milnesiophthora]